MTQADAFPETVTHPEQDTDERYTPRPLFLDLHREFGFTLDACATKESAKLDRYFTKQDDGLKQSWKGQRVFFNPPWSDIESWVLKAWRECERAELAVGLLPVWTDRQWWHDHVEKVRDTPSSPLRTRFLRGRIRFGHPGNPDGVGVESPNFWCCLLIWRGEP
jgi:phage N-6-adenine-methyltransferase